MSNARAAVIVDVPRTRVGKEHRWRLEPLPIRDETDHRANGVAWLMRPSSIPSEGRTAPTVRYRRGQCQTGDASAPRKHDGTQRHEERSKSESACLRWWSDSEEVT
jgi:hypothetical protein